MGLDLAALVIATNPGFIHGCFQQWSHINKNLFNV